MPCSTSKLIKISDFFSIDWFCHLLALHLNAADDITSRLQSGGQGSFLNWIIKCTGHNQDTDEELSSFLWPGPSLILLFPLLGYQRGCWTTELMNHTWRTNLEICIAPKVCSGKMKWRYFCQRDISVLVSEGCMEPNYKSKQKKTGSVNACTWQHYSWHRIQ